MRFRTKRRGTVSIDTAEEFCAEDREKTPEIFYKSLGGLTYTQINPKVGFWLRRLATAFEPACIAQLIQVELLRRRLHLVQIQDASLPNSQLLNSFVYKRLSLN